MSCGCAPGVAAAQATTRTQAPTVTIVDRQSRMMHEAAFGAPNTEIGARPREPRPP